MNIELEKNDIAFIVKIKGEVDHHTCELIKESVDGGIMLHRCKNVIFDFYGVRFMDSSGIGMLIGRYKRAILGGGRVVVCSLNRDVEKLFSLTGIKKIIPVFESIEAAKKYLREVD